MPGLGRPWLDKFASDVYPSDQVLIKRDDRYVPMRPPKYYDRVFERDNPEIFEKVAARRKGAALEALEDADLSSDRFQVLERIMELKYSKLKRGYEDA